MNVSTDTRIGELKIIGARITEMPKKITDPMPKVRVLLEGIEGEQDLFSYYPDELSFTPEEFIGLTVKQGLALLSERDKVYLQS